jgi:hypothetical protein
VSAPDAPPGAAPDPADDPRHPERALAPDHALGLLDDAERRAFEAHLAGCAECRAEARAYAETTALLAAALPAAAPPPGLRARVVAEARAAGGAAAAPASNGAAAGAPAAAWEPRVVPGGAAPGAPARGAPAGRARAAAWGARAPWLAAAASLALAAGLGAAWARERDTRRVFQLALRERTDRLMAIARVGAAGDAADRDTLRAALARRDTAITELNTLVAALTEDGVPDGPPHRHRRARAHAPHLEPSPRRGGGHRRAARRAGAGARLPALGDRARWAAAEPGRVPARARRRAPRGAPVPTGAAMDVAAVTVEPDGGSPQPTSAPVMTGSIGAE